jgi:hypothetical protein
MELFIPAMMTCSLFAVVLLGITLHKIRSMRQQLQRMEKNVGSIAASMQTAFSKEKLAGMTTPGMPEHLAGIVQPAVSSEHPTGQEGKELKAALKHPICQEGKSRIGDRNEAYSEHPADVSEKEALLDAVLGEVFS